VASRERDTSGRRARSHARTAVSDLIHDVPVTAPRQRHVCSKPPAVEGLPQARSCACGELRAKCCLEANVLHRGGTDPPDSVHAAAVARFGPRLALERHARRVSVPRARAHGLLRHCGVPLVPVNWGREAVRWRTSQRLILSMSSSTTSAPTGRAGTRRPIVAQCSKRC
jgi:hypothetical protein